MRRKDREIVDSAFFEEVFSSAETMFIAMFDGDFPYCIPVNFAAKERTIYIHSSLEGHKLNLIDRNPHVAFSAAIGIEIDITKASTYYRSICGRGIATVIEDESEKAFALDLIGERYKALCKRPSPLANVRRVAIIRIAITAISGKWARKEQD